MQNTFAKKYYKNPTSKSKHSLLLTSLSLCILSSVVSFLSFNDGNLNKSICWQFYQSCKDSNLISNQHTFINNSKLYKLQRNEMNVARFLCGKHLHLHNVYTWNFDILINRILARDWKNIHFVNYQQISSEYSHLFPKKPDCSYFYTNTVSIYVAILVDGCIFCFLTLIRVQSCVIRDQIINMLQWINQEHVRLVVNVRNLSLVIECKRYVYWMPIGSG